MMEHVLNLIKEAERCNQRRLVVLAMRRDEALRRIEEIMEALPNKEKIVFTWKQEKLKFGTTERLKNAVRYMGTTYDIVAMDLHESFVPNDLGKIAGMVRGGGLLILLTPPFEEWKNQSNYFHESILTPPYQMGDMKHNFIPWVIKKLMNIEGIAIYEETKWVKKGHYKCTAPNRYEAKYNGMTLLSLDQKQVLEEIMNLKKIGVVLTADRGRGKSSTLGIAIANLIKNKKVRRVCITAPERENLRELLKFMEIAFRSLNINCPPRTCKGRGFDIRIVEPAYEMRGCDMIVADEAAGIPVHILLKYSKAKNVIYSTTTHGYEGTGRAFSVRFLSELKKRRKDVVHLKMQTPIRYAPDDPVEKWLFSTLLLDSEPATLSSVDVKKVEYRKYKIEELLKNEKKLREFYGIFVLAHYRNNPNDFGIICDAPNHEIRTLEYEGHVVCAVQIAREGNLGDWTEEMYYGYVPPGNIVPDVVIKHYRDREFANLRGMRIVRIATHPDFMNMGLGTEMLKNIKKEKADWLGASFGATPQLMRFWHRSGFVPIHIAPRMNEKTGEYSVVVLNSIKAHEKLGRKFAERFLLTLGDVHSFMDSHIAQSILSAIPTRGKMKIDDLDMKRIIAYAWGPGNYEVTADAIWKLAVQYFLSNKKPKLSAEQERILIARTLQHKSWRDAGKAVNRGEMYVVIELREAVRRLIGENDEVLEFQRRFHGADS